MGARANQFRHVVDVDGRLLGIDARVVDVAALLGIAGLDPHRSVILVLEGRRLLIPPGQLIRLDEDQVAFFETVPAASWRSISLAVAA